MKILWFTWKDLSHPQAGGAELVNEELAKRLVRDGHEVMFIVGSYKGAALESTVDGYKIVRLGNRYTTYFKTFRYYRRHLIGWADMVIDEVNTMPYFAKYYVREPSMLFVHMLCRKIWFYQFPLPLSAIGFILEPLYLRLINNSHVVTVSESTKQDLLRHGFKPDNIKIISEGINMEPLTKLPPVKTKYPNPTLLSLGAMRPMKRTLHQIKAFEAAKKYIPDLKLEIAGDSNTLYGKQVLKAIDANPHTSDIHYYGKVNERKKLSLLRKSHALLQTSVKEGWGLTVTEANSQGTPAVVYDVDGLRDSVHHAETGLIAAKEDPEHLADSIVTLFENRKTYAALRTKAWRWSQSINFDTAYRQFSRILQA